MTFRELAKRMPLYFVYCLDANKTRPSWWPDLATSLLNGRGQMSFHIHMSKGILNSPRFSVFLNHHFSIKSKFQHIPKIPHYSDQGAVFSIREISQLVGEFENLLK